MSSLTSLCRLHRLIWDDSLRAFITPDFPRGRFEYVNTLEQVELNMIIGIVYYSAQISLFGTCVSELQTVMMPIVNHKIFVNVAQNS